MNKYNHEQIKKMAKQALLAQSKGDPRYMELIMRLMIITGMTQQMVESKIQELAA